MNRFENWKPPLFDEDGWTYKNDYDNQHMYACGYGQPYGWRCQYYKNLKLGKRVDVGCFTYMNAKFGIEIGDNVQIGGGCYIYSESTIDNKKGRIIIKENAKIGTTSVILPDVIIGKNSVIGAGSVVLSGTIIPDNEVWIGIPCKKKSGLFKKTQLENALKDGSISEKDYTRLKEKYDK